MKLQNQLNQAQETKDWWEKNAIHWREQCYEAWRQRDELQSKVDDLQQELIQERGYL